MYKCLNHCHCTQILRGHITLNPLLDTETYRLGFSDCILLQYKLLVSDSIEFEKIWQVVSLINKLFLVKQRKV